MSRLAISVLLVAVVATACARSPSGSATPPTDAPSSEATSSAEPEDCGTGGCPVPDCQRGTVVNAQIDHVPDAVGVTDVESDVEDWLDEIGGAGQAAGIPTPHGRIAFLVSSEGSDVALLWYVSDGHDGWLRESYVACQSALGG
jgi:hypothetical protein